MDATDLTVKQREVVDAIDNVVLVLGGAGCGKTTTALWAARAAIERAADPMAKVAFLTFSRTAVDQISLRAASAISGLGDRIEVSTFHSIAYRLVRSFGRYADMGSAIPEIQTQAQIKLLGTRAELLTYDDLIPRALSLLRSEKIRQLLGARWPLVICDEFQDTSDEQWELLDMLRGQSRLLLLADPNQMIYTYVRGVGPERVESVRALAASVIELEPASHRDPSGAIPALATSILRRDFTAVPVTTALASGRLRIRTNVDDDDLVDVITGELRLRWQDGAKDYGIFGYSNDGVADLSRQLGEAGVHHTLIGLPEAQGEAMSAMAVMCAFAVGLADARAVRLALATFLTSCTRGKTAPELAHQLANDKEIPGPLVKRLEDLSAALVDAMPDALEVSRVIQTAWARLGIIGGSAVWRRACAAFGPVMNRSARGRLLDDRVAATVLRDTAELRSAALLDSSRYRLPPVKLMNFHQTKGREADAVLLVYRNGDYLADRRDREPFLDPSRVLYVALTRARQSVTVILPSDPHPLVAPFSRLHTA